MSQELSEELSNQPLVDINDGDTAMVDTVSSESSTTSSDISPSNSSVDLKKVSPQQDSSFYITSKVDLSSAADQILPPLEDEEIEEMGSYTWEIEKYSGLTELKYRGPSFKVGGYDWNILLFPKGNSNNNVALYLEPLPKRHKVEGTDEEFPDNPDWYVCAQFTLVMSNPANDKEFHISTSHQRFNKNATDWGFSNFIDVQQLKRGRGSAGPMLNEDKLNITAFVKVLKDPTGVLWHNLLDYDSKKETGFVGFNNQGATCYLNSLLQSYFFTKSFRKAVYQIPTDDVKVNESVPLALQKIFYQLQRSDEALDTSELTKSFGWDTGDAFTQHDVQELNRILMDKLEASMKGTPVEKVLNQTFVGKMKSYIKCINVEYESSRTEDFWDIQLNVKNLSNLTESFQNYIEVELMDGENQYAAQDFGLQDAKKGVVFEEFPKVLHLQLKRFEYDYNYDTLVKVNDRYEFPETIDLSPFLDHEDKSKTVGPHIYDLHGVLVHAGDLTAGHYYALIKPDKSGNWYRFDDDKVWRVTKRQVFEENFGMDAIDAAKLTKFTRTQQQNYQIRRHTSAYMLVYIKRDAINEVLEEVDEADVPKHVSSQVISEIEEAAKKRKELEELHLYLTIYFYSNKLFKKYQGFDLGADKRLTAPGIYSEEYYPVKIKVLKTSKFTDLFDELKDKLNIDPKAVKFVSMSYRRNYTLRPANEIKDIENLTIEQISNTAKKYGCSNIFIEEPKLELMSSLNKTLDTVALPVDDINVSEESVETSKQVIFLKYFDADSQTLKGLTHIVVTEDTIIGSIVPYIKEYLGIFDEFSLDLYEEVNSGSIEKLDQTLSFYESELSNGDIITIQKSETLLEEKNPNKIYPFYETADFFYEYLRTRIHVNIQPLTKPSNDDEYVISKKDENVEPFDFWISTNATFDELAQRIALKTNETANCLRIFVNYNGYRTLLRADSFVNDYIPKSLPSSITPLFEYEVLSIPLKELENMKLVKINWLPSGYSHYQVYEFSMKENDTLADLIDKLQVKVGISDEDKSSILIWSNVQSRFYQVLYPDNNVKMIDDSIDVFASVLTEESQILKKYYSGEENSSNESLPKFIPVIQFFKDPRKLHGISFLFVLYAGENLEVVKSRLQKKIGLGQKEFSKVQVCLWDPQARAPEYLTNTDENGNMDDFILYDEISASEYLALDHPDRTSRQGVQQNNGSGNGISIR